LEMDGAVPQRGAEGVRAQRELVATTPRAALPTDLALFPVRRFGVSPEFRRDGAQASAPSLGEGVPQRAVHSPVDIVGNGNASTFHLVDGELPCAVFLEASRLDMPDAEDVVSDFVQEDREGEGSAWPGGFDVASLASVAVFDDDGDAGGGATPLADPDIVRGEQLASDGLVALGAG
jgi:hypothetical protein